MQWNNQTHIRKETVYLLGTISVIEGSLPENIHMKRKAMETCDIAFICENY